MKKKIKALEIKSFRKISSMFYPMKSKFNSDMLKPVFNDEEISEIENDFSNFYKLVFNNCIDEQSKELLRRYKENLKSTYFIYLYEAIAFSPYRRAARVGDKAKKIDLINDKELRQTLMLRERQKLFFLADIVIAFVMGNEEELGIIKKILSEEKNKRRRYSIELLKKTKEIETKKNNDIPKPTQTECIILANRKTKDFDESDLIDEYSKPTQLLIDIRDSYKSQKKTL